MQTFGVALAAGAADLLSNKAQAAPGPGDQLVPHGATALADLTKRLSEAPRRLTSAQVSDVQATVKEILTDFLCNGT